MSTLEQTAPWGQLQSRGEGQQREPTPEPGRADVSAAKKRITAAGSAVRAGADEHLAAIDDLIHGLQDATATYRARMPDWGDVAALGRVREHLAGAVEVFHAAEAAAELSRAARAVATDVRRFGPRE